jgi:large subunit ribosomal protein L35
MPKAKTNKAAAKRMKKTGTGKIKRYRACGSHKMTAKSRKRKRVLRQETLVDKANSTRVKRLLPNL